MTDRADDGRPRRRFALYLEDPDEVACRAADADGFFGGEPDADGRGAFRLVDATPGDANAWRALANRTGKSLGNAEVRILDDGGGRIGAYFVADVRVVGRSEHPADDGQGQPGPGDGFDLDIDCLQVQAPSPLAGPIWERWRHGAPTQRNQWADLPRENRSAWLEVVRLSRTPPPAGDAPPGSVFDLDGTHVDDRPSFYCALGEAVNGPGGYFGADLDALADCLRGGFGATTPFTLVWHHHNESAARLTRLDDGPDGPFYDRLLRILNAGGVTVRPALEP